ncbi:hypothetical protein SS50377_25367 [Spironucleus salmonicida]|uniref:Transmembrane protein n=1 Tax=Spironucleus salmonicida TaxID=348837 RepID=V6LDL0_9EUKA|nr:hypothetical protein SS50377_25367 [Spironucleus salmonicida]|eukprot:EST41756.1 Hypothetical protein SS50377_18589 [Spironucleus salmonicida]
MLLQVIAFTCYQSTGDAILQNQTNDASIKLLINHAQNDKDHEICHAMVYSSATLTLIVGLFQFSGQFQFDDTDLMLNLKKVNEFDIVDLQSFTLATYQVSFDDSDLIFEDSISQLYWKAYDDENCFIDAFFIYETEKEFGVKFISNPVCVPNGTGDITLILYLNGVIILQETMPVVGFDFASISYFFKTCTDEDFSCKMISLNIGQDLVANGELTFIIPQAFTIQADDFDEKDGTTISVPVDIIVPKIYNKKFSARLTPEADCYEYLNIELMKYQFIIYGTQGLQTECNDKLLDNLAPGGSLAIQIIINSDQKIFSIEKRYESLDFTNSRFFIVCDEECRDEMDYYHHQDNLELQVGFIIYTQQNTYRGAIRYPANFSKNQYIDGNIQVFDSMVLIKLYQSYYNYKETQSIREVYLRTYSTVVNFDKRNPDFSFTVTILFPNDQDEYYFTVDHTFFKKAIINDYIVSLEVGDQIFIASTNSIQMQRDDFLLLYIVPVIVGVSVSCYCLTIYLLKRNNDVD